MVLLEAARATFVTSRAAEKVRTPMLQERRFAEVTRGQLGIVVTVASLPLLCLSCGAQGDSSEPPVGAASTGGSQGAGSTSDAGATGATAGGPTTAGSPGDSGSDPTEGDGTTGGEQPIDCSERGYRQALLERRVGWGRAAGEGALDWPSVVVTNTDASGEGSLRAALERDDPAWITFAPDVQGKTIDLGNSDDEITMRSNKVIDGRGAPVTITGAGLYATDRKRNLILHNICIRGISGGGSQSGDGIRLSNSTDIWVDHVTVEDANDGGLDVTTWPGRIDPIIRVSIGYSRFIGTEKNLLLANTPNDPDDWEDDADDGHTGLVWVSVYRNYLADGFARNPFARGIAVHLWNNWVDDFGENSGRGQGFVFGDYPGQNNDASHGPPLWGTWAKIENNVIGSTKADGGLLAPGGDRNQYTRLERSGTVFEGVARDEFPDKLIRELPDEFVSALDYPYEVDSTDNHETWKAEAGCRETPDREAFLAACEGP